MAVPPDEIEELPDELCGSIDVVNVCMQELSLGKLIH